MAGYVGRLAPSPTGALHLGNVRTFMVAWLRARQAGGRLILRMEDLDHPKHKPGADVQAIDDLRWLGFDWDEEYVQSQRKHLYAAALDTLVSKGLAYPCVCSRSDIEAVQSAPHEGEQLRYPGTCRDRFASWEDACAAMDAPLQRTANYQLPTTNSLRIPCWRFRTPEDSHVSFDDVFAGRYEMDVWEKLGDFPLARDEKGGGYAIAVTVDDAAMGVTEVVRGDDLLPATPPQILLYHALGLREPAFFHVPLVVGPDGRRLAKRHGDTRISAFRAAGVSAERIIGYLAQSLGIVPDRKPIGLRSLTSLFDPARIPHAPLVFNGFT
jgi:glutamyl-tRNA synthetase